MTARVPSDSLSLVFTQICPQCLLLIHLPLRVFWGITVLITEGPPKLLLWMGWDGLMWRRHRCMVLSVQDVETWSATCPQMWNNCSILGLAPGLHSHTHMSVSHPHLLLAPTSTLPTAPDTHRNPFQAFTASASFGTQAERTPRKETWKVNVSKVPLTDYKGSSTGGVLAEKPYACVWFLCEQNRPTS